jgi:hypothetical protein
LAHQNSIDIMRVIAIIQIVFLVLFFVMAQAVERLMAAGFVFVVVGGGILSKVPERGKGISG